MVDFNQAHVFLLLFKFFIQPQTKNKTYICLPLDQNPKTINLQIKSTIIASPTNQSIKQTKQKKIHIYMYIYINLHNQICYDINICEKQTKTKSNHKQI